MQAAITDDIKLKQELRNLAKQAGFCAAGVAPASLPSQEQERLRSWLAAGMAGEMEYLSRADIDRSNARTVLPGAESVIVLAAEYYPGSESPNNGDATLCRIARYAVGEDYHLVLRERLAPILQWLAEMRPGHEWRACVDTAPLLERAYGAAAGVGFVGKNSCLIRPSVGSYLFLVEIVTTAAIAHDEPVAGTCGTCRRCIDACPTQAIVAPCVLDARRCISFRTIEMKSPPTEELLRQNGEWAFGCDVCQDVCPYNKHPGISPIPEFHEGRILHQLQPIDDLGLELSNREFARQYARSPVARAGRKRLAVNAEAAARNRGK